MKKTYILLGMALSMAITAHSQRILFDNTKGETAGNADWVIDADVNNLGIGSSGPYIGGTESNAQRTPTPLQSGITSTTSESYWTGGISSWGVECVKTGYTVESLPYGTAITYGTGAAQDLSKYDAYIVDEPNLVYTAAEKTAIINFVKNGGGLFLISDHSNSDRNGDGWDSPRIWNNLMDTNSITTNPFGLHFDNAYFDGSYFTPSLPGDSLLHGPYGAATSVKWTGGNTMTLSTSINPTVKAVAYKSGNSGANGALIAYGRYGKGKFVAMADSSPTDDASGDTNDQLYDGWITDANGNHRRLIMNATIWLVAKNTATGIEDAPAAQIISIVPNPAKETLHIKSPKACTVEIYNISGQRVMYGLVSADENAVLNISDLNSGIYIVKLIGEEINFNEKIIKQ